jgi:hypothetical protein
MGLNLKSFENRKKGIVGLGEGVSSLFAFVKWIIEMDRFPIMPSYLTYQYFKVSYL